MTSTPATAHEDEFPPLPATNVRELGVVRQSAVNSFTSFEDLPAVLTVEEAASVLRIGRSCAYAAVRAGEIPSIRVGRAIRIPTHRLEVLLGRPQNDEEPGGNRLFVADRMEESSDATN